MNNTMKIMLTIFVVLLVYASRDKTHDESRYPYTTPPMSHDEKSYNSTTFVEDFNKEITMVLAKNNVRGCGQYKYISGTHSGEYAVLCTSNGTTWTGYVVWYPSMKIMGPRKEAALLEFIQK